MRTDLAFSQSLAEKYRPTRIAELRRLEVKLMALWGTRNDNEGLRYTRGCPPSIMGQDVSMQTRELRQFTEARDWSVAGEYIDAGVSGAKDSRPELNRLMGDAHKRRFDVVCVWRFDRFARSVSHLLRRWRPSRR